VVHTFTAAGSANLTCTDFGAGDDVSEIKITAIQVKSLTNTGF
jgi:hypothetical protein